MSSVFLMPCLVFRPLTAASRSCVCSNAPLTCTLKLQESWFADGSVAVDCTIVSPIGKTLPEGGVQTIVAPQLSVAVTGNGTTAPAGLVALTTIGPGHAITGGSVSWTVTVNVHGADAPPDVFVA